MKRKYFVTILPTLLFLLSCTSQPESSGRIVEIDLTKEYPVKEINLRDIADVTYVRFNADTDNYLFSGSIVSVTENNIIIHDYRNGDFYVFTKEGKPGYHFNKRGNGPAEYNHLRAIVYDEKRDELFVTTRNMILVYTLAGEYKRTLSLPQDIIGAELFEFDDKTLLLFDEYRRMQNFMYHMSNLNGENSQSKEGLINEENIFESSFVLISKEDGKLIKAIPVPESFMRLGVPVTMGGRTNLMGGITRRLAPYKDGFLVFNVEKDTIYSYDKNHVLSPLWVQTPSIADVELQQYISPFVETGNYQFFEKTVLKFEPGKRPPTEFLMRDKNNDQIYTQKVVLDDFKGKEITISTPVINRSKDAKSGYIMFSLEELQEAYEENRLSGELKELVASLDEEDNDICVLLHFK